MDRFRLQGRRQRSRVDSREVERRDRVKEQRVLYYVPYIRRERAGRAEQRARRKSKKDVQDGG